MKTAVVHDWLTGMRGGERVLESILEIYPQADVYTLLHLRGAVSGRIERHPIRTSFIQRLPGLRRHYRAYLPLFPLAIEGFDLAGYDLVISSSHCVALGARTGAGTLHVCYCHTPMRYIYDQFDAYFPRRGLGVRRALIAAAAHYLRGWDSQAGRRVDAFVANSQHVARRIRKYYGAPAQVVHPPVDTAFFTPAGRPGPRYLAVGAGAPYKRLDLAIQACRMLGSPLTIVGWGPEMIRWRKMADSGVDFRGAVSDEELRELYRSARALIFPAEEDFGIVPLEAMACGRPVIAFGRGGATETVVDGRTGVLFAEQTAGCLADALRRCQGIEFDPQAARARALEFSRERFAARFEAAVRDAWREFGSVH